MPGCKIIRVIPLALDSGNGLSLYHDDTRRGRAQQLARLAWSPGQATEEIRALAKSESLSLSYKVHATQRLVERGLVVSDILHVLKNGFVHSDAVPATRPGYFRYCMECLSPNSGRRSLGVVVIPDRRACTLKIVTVMWMDETSTVAGSIIGE